MKVWLVWCLHQWEYPEIVSVHASEEAANQVRMDRKAIETPQSLYGYAVSEHEVID